MESEPPAPAVFLPRLDDCNGPAQPLSAAAETTLVNAALLACGFSSEALASLPTTRTSSAADAHDDRAAHQRGGAANAERASGEFPREVESSDVTVLKAAPPAGLSPAVVSPAAVLSPAVVLSPAALSPVVSRSRGKSRGSARPLLGTVGRGAVILAILASSTAAAALTLEWPRVKAVWTQVWAETPEENTATVADARGVERFRGKALIRRVSPETPVAAPPAVSSAGATAVELGVIEPGVSESEAAALTARPAPRERGATIASKAPVPVAQAAEYEPAKAEDLLGAANALRAERRYAEALEKYTAVLRVYPKSAQARAARVAAATLRLERLNDAAGARELLREATSNDRAGAEGSGSRAALPEADFALAEAFRAAGDSFAEKSALRRFVARYPDHPLFAVAERRLRELQRAADPRKTP